MNRVLFYFTIKYQGDWEKIYTALSLKEGIDKNSLNDTLMLKKDNYLCLVDFIYPENLKFIYKPPFSLFWKGNFKLFEKQMISLFAFTEMDFQKINLASDIKDYITFVVDYNDEDLIDYLIKHKFNFMAVLNRSIESVCNTNYYQKIIDSNNLVLTEYPFNTKQVPLDVSYLRIISGITRIVLVGNDTSNWKLEKLQKICKGDEIKTFSINNPGDLINFGFKHENSLNIKKS